MAPAIHIDVRWLLEQHETALPDQPHISDYSALVAAVARHRVDPPRLGFDPDASWRAAALLHTLLLLRPLPSLN
ncbi:toxin Doc, partial [Streptomyces olivaceoviridis]